MGIVEDVGSQVSTIKRGDRVIAPFAFSDGTCEFCHKGLQTNCLHGGFWGQTNDGGQAEAIRAPLADGMLVVVPKSVEGDEAQSHPSSHRCHGDRPLCGHSSRGTSRSNGCHHR